MTAINGPILFNNSSGSDSAASGLGPATAVSGTGGATDGTTTVDLSADSPDLSGVSAGDLLWIAASTGRQFSIIASVDDGADTVTCDDAFSNTEGSLSWGIGGKRALLFGSTSGLNLLQTSAKGDWVMELESGHVDSYSTTPDTSLDGSTSLGAITIRGASGAATRPQLLYTGTGKGMIVRSIGWVFQDFDWLQNNASGASVVCDATVGGNRFIGVHMKPTGSGTGWSGVDNGNNRHFVACEIANMSGSGLSVPDGATVAGCYIHDCGSHGISCAASLGPNFLNNVIANNGGDGINWAFGGASNRSGRCIGNVLHNNTGDGLELTGGPSGAWNNLSIFNNIFTDNGGYGLNFSSVSASEAAAEYYGLFADYNAYRNNTSGARNNIAAGDNDVTLTADPYTDAANDDFTLNSTAGGGAACADAGFPQTIPGT